MLTIDTLSLQLPAGFEQRAERIGRLVAAALARLEIGASARIAHLALPPLQLANHTTDAELAARIADAIRRQLAGDRRASEARSEARPGAGRLAPDRSGAGTREHGVRR